LQPVQQGCEGAGMTISPADERTFILSDEIIAHIDNFFPSPNDHHEKIIQASAALQALINVIGVVLCEIDCTNCWELTLKAVESSFAQMLKDAPVLRAEFEAEHRAQTIN
jgi:hypothetical protein